MARSIEGALTAPAAEDGGMKDVTPTQVGAAAAAQRPRPLSTGTAFEHDGVRLVSVAYLGRKNNRGTVSRRTPVGENIDVTVPGEENADAVSDYESGIGMQNIPDDKKEEAGLLMLTPEFVHIDGRHYHFEQGRVNHRVHPDDVSFLLAHAVYKFERVTPDA